MTAQEGLAMIESLWLRDLRLSQTVPCPKCNAEIAEACWWTFGDSNDFGDGDEGEFHLERLLLAKRRSAPLQ